MLVCGLVVGVTQAEPPQRGPPPPIPSYRQHVETQDDHFYQEVSPPRDSDNSDRALTNKQSSMTPPPTAHYDTPLVHARRKTISGRISNSTEPSSTTPHAPLRPLRSTPATTANMSTKATHPRPSGTVRPKNQTFQRDPPPPPRVRVTTLTVGGEGGTALYIHTYIHSIVICLCSIVSTVCMCTYTNVCTVCE